MGSTALGTLDSQGLPDGLKPGGETVNSHVLQTDQQSNGIILFLLFVVVES